MPNFESYCRCPGCGSCDAAKVLNRIKDAMIAWANESERKGGTTAWGPLFNDAMDAAKMVRTHCRKGALLKTGE